MNQHVMRCLVIKQNGGGQSNLEAALRRSHFKPEYQYINNSTELYQCLEYLPALLFCPGSMSAAQREQLTKVVYKWAPDCIVAYSSVNQWSGLSKDLNRVATCTLTTGKPAELWQQLDYLLAYAQMKSEFRDCKHLLNIIEQRNQWLVEYSREAVAYISGNQHLYVNAVYMNLFGFDTELGALNASVLKLVLPAHQQAFSSLSRESERKAALPNKVLLHMCSSGKKARPFRAEVRFIPAVFRGQRCIQLHVHPLVDSSADGTKSTKLTAPDPWTVRLPATQNNAVKKAKKSVGQSVKKVVVRENHNRLKVDFKELLNLKGSSNLAAFMVQPYLKQSGEKISGRQLQSKLNDRARQVLNEQCLEAAVRYLYKRFSHPLKHLVWVELGEWVFTDSKRLEWLLNFLNKNKKINTTLVISLDVGSCTRLRESAVKVLPLLQSTGVKIALDGVRQLMPEVLAIQNISQAILLRTHPDLLKETRESGVISEALNQVLQFQQASIVVDGVRDVSTMNLLCDSDAGYLYGDVLDKFSR
uniref:EAL domain-containing protein n=1 Tax=uncultured Thiotrichaceae bacterium TaxID=298394 RepID=A0A6S6U5A5_9GAMM|nr:MAG: Unknown protein [uncultured Thiotrichaceae bacterium]